MTSLRDLMALAICEADCGRVTPNELARCEGLADAALAAIEAAGTHVAMLEYEAIARAASAYLAHPDLASAAATLQGMVKRAERVLAARPRDVATTGPSANTTATADPEPGR